MKSVRWGWVIAGGVIAEAALWVVLLSLSLLFTGGISRPPMGAPWWVHWRWIPACFFGPFATTFWLGRRKITSHVVLHGFLIGLLCFILGPPVMGPPRTPFFIGIALLKIAGAATGSLVASKRSRPVLAGITGTTGEAA
jgi:hypothetical protein